MSSRCTVPIGARGVSGWGRKDLCYVTCGQLQGATIYEAVKCPNAKCGETMERGKYAAHAEECLYRRADASTVGIRTPSRQ